MTGSYDAVQMARKISRIGAKKITGGFVTEGAAGLVRRYVGEINLAAAVELAYSGSPTPIGAIAAITADRGISLANLFIAAKLIGKERKISRTTSAVSTILGLFFLIYKEAGCVAHVVA